MKSSSLVVWNGVERRNEIVSRKALRMCVDYALELLDDAQKERWLTLPGIGAFHENTDSLW